MRYVRRYRGLPMFLRVVNILGFLFFLASLALATVSLIMFSSSYPHIPADDERVRLVSMNLGMLGLACLTTTIGSTFRLGRSDARSLPVASWQRQARNIMLFAALPLCALTLAMFITPSQSVYGLAFGISYLAAWVLLVGIFVLIIRRLSAH
ncbi:MAG TPA: hypothetical protein VJO13_18305 [Ktedonobacterales bacterium]|nr:hypothetical protein [Ktedonobacterales bacterium]